MEEIKEKNSRVRRRWRGAWYHSARAKSNGFDLAVLAPSVKFVAVESKADTAGVSGFDDDFLPSADSSLTAGFQKFGRGCFAIRGDRDPGFLSGLDDEGKLAWKRGS